MRTLGARCAVLTGCLAGLLALFFLFVRPWYRGWGADQDGLRNAHLPGDTLLWRGTPHETRAVLIHAPAEQVWPWIAQIGQDRGGFYSYEILEDLAGCEMTNLDHLDPSLQRWKAGDKLWMYPPRKAGGVGQAPLALHSPGHALVFYTRRPTTPLTAPPDGTWAFIVEPADRETSHFIMRATAQGRVGLLGTAFERGVFEPIHFAMERKMMEGVKARAEGKSVSKTRDDLQVLLWTITFGLFVASAVLVIRGRAWRWHAFTFTASGVLFGVLTLVQPSVFIGAPLVMALALATGPGRPLAQRLRIRG